MTNVSLNDTSNKKVSSNEDVDDFESQIYYDNSISSDIIQVPIVKPQKSQKIKNK